MFSEAFPILSTADLPRALAFYRDGLGGEVTYQFPADGEPVYVSMRIGKSALGLGAEEHAAEASARHALWVYADDCDRAVERLVTYGATVTEPPADQPWGERVARLTDPDGNRLVIGSR
jgi:lactoylglutathione lyase